MTDSNISINAQLIENPDSFDNLDSLNSLDGFDNPDDLDSLNSLENEDDGQLYEHFRIVADRGQVPTRVDKFLFEHLQHSSRNRIQKAAEAGFIHVNEQPVKSNYKVRPMDVVTLMMNRPRHDDTIEPEDIPLDIVYEDDQLMVVNKPAGMVVHPGCGNYHGTLVNAIAWHLRNLPSYDPNDPEVGLVHRIDKDTSGLLVVAKTPEAKSNLGVQFFNKTTHRSYNALVWGNLKDDEGRIEGNIGRDPKDRLRMSVFPPDSEIGKPAVTHYRVLERFGYTTWVECILETGRTHQIRAHMKHIGFCEESAAPPTAPSSRTASSSAHDRCCMPERLASSIPPPVSRWTSRPSFLPTLLPSSPSGAPMSVAPTATRSNKNPADQKKISIITIITKKTTNHNETHQKKHSHRLRWRLTGVCRINAFGPGPLLLFRQGALQRLHR